MIKRGTFSLGGSFPRGGALRGGGLGGVGVRGVIRVFFFLGGFFSFALGRVTAAIRNSSTSRDVGLTGGLIRGRSISLITTPSRSTTMVGPLAIWKSRWNRDLGRDRRRVAAG